MPASKANRRWLKIAGISVAVALLLGFGGMWYLSPQCEDEGCPPVDRLRSYRPPEPPQIYDADGELAGQLSGPRRVVVDMEEVPEIVREGYIAVEDRRFREHGGVDYMGGLRAFWRNVTAGEIVEGGSTITMQLARNVFGPEVLDYSRWHRKLTEIRMAREIEGQLDKDRILRLYLNQIYLGDGVYGVETAARHYFGKSVSDVTPEEAALLVGLAQSPEGYNPRRNPQRALERRNNVLEILAREGVITPEEMAEARESDIDLTESSAHSDWGANAYYFAAVRRELREIFPLREDRVGVRIHTGLDPRLQEVAQEALRWQLRQIESGRYGAFRHDVAPDDLSQAVGVSPYLQGMIVAMDPESGRVRALMSGRDYRHSEFDRAFQARRQSGSAFKPIVYSAALGQGLRLSQEISTEPVRFARSGMEDWEPQDHASGQKLTVRDALVHSSNSAAVRVGTRVGIDRVIRQAHTLGIEDEIPHYPSIYLGAADVIPARLTAAYAAFGNGGRRVEPHLIDRVENPDGRVLWQREVETARALSPEIAFLLLDVMRDVVNRGTGWRARESGYRGPAAGKTGTTNESRDGWFIGMSPELLTGVWVGFDRPQTIVSDAGGGDLAAPAWGRFMHWAHMGESLQEWSPPPGVTRVRLDAETGFPLAEGCPFEGPVQTEYFISGTQPHGYCPSEGDRFYYRTEEGRWAWDSTGGYWRRQQLREDSVRAGRADTLGDEEDRRTIFYRGDEEREERLERERDRLQNERERRATVLDSLRRAREGRERGDTARPPPPDTTDTTRVRTRDTIRVRPDTTGPRRDTTGTPPDTIPPDTSRIRPDTSRVESAPSPDAAGGPTGR